MSFNARRSPKATPINAQWLATIKHPTQAKTYIQSGPYTNNDKFIVVHNWNWDHRHPYNKDVARSKGFDPNQHLVPREVGKQKVFKKPSYSFQIQVLLLKMDMVHAPNSKGEGMVIAHQNLDVT